LVFVHRRDVRRAHGVIVRTGETLGQLSPETRWSYNAVSVRHRKHINKSGHRRQNKARSDPARDWYNQTAEALVDVSTKKSSLALNNSHAGQKSKVTKKDVLGLVSAELPPMVDLPTDPPAVESARLDAEKQPARKPFAFDINIPLLPVRRR
jgi:hypothetical protein